eukprot:7528209-Lingulodinium_polyedra.AAC.1
MTFGSGPRCVLVRAWCAAPCAVGRGAAVSVPGLARVWHSGRQSRVCCFGSRRGCVHGGYRGL